MKYYVLNNTTISCIKVETSYNPVRNPADRGRGKNRKDCIGMAHMNLMQTAERSRQSSDSSTENEEVYTIGDVASEYGVTLRTLRFYEDRGLLNPRREGTTRYYSASDRERLKMIMKGKHLGFTLTEIKDMIASKNSSSNSPTYELALKPEQVIAQINHLERQRQEIDQAITELRAVHAKTV